MIICPDWLIHLINALAMIENEAELAYSNWMPRPFQCFTDEGFELWRTAVVWLASRDERTRIHILTQPPMEERRGASVCLHSKVESSQWSPWSAVLIMLLYGYRSKRFPSLSFSISIFCWQELVFSSWVSLMLDPFWQTDPSCLARSLPYLIPLLPS